MIKIHIIADLSNYWYKIGYWTLETNYLFYFVFLYISLNVNIEVEYIKYLLSIHFKKRKLWDFQIQSPNYIFWLVYIYTYTNNSQWYHFQLICINIGKKPYLYISILYSRTILQFLVTRSFMKYLVSVMLLMSSIIFWYLFRFHCKKYAKYEVKLDQYKYFK